MIAWSSCHARHQAQMCFLCCLCNSLAFTIVGVSVCLSVCVCASVCLCCHMCIRWSVCLCMCVCVFVCLSLLARKRTHRAAVEYCPMQDSWIFNILSFRFTPMEFPSIAVPPVESASAGTVACHAPLPLHASARSCVGGRCCDVGRAVAAAREADVAPPGSAPFLHQGRNARACWKERQPRRGALLTC
jgi:hypothetical protein